MSLRSKGFFITFEGPEGSGKSSQSRRLVAWLRRQGRAVTHLRDPGSTALGRQVRNVLLHSQATLSPLLEALLFIGGRVRLVDERIRPTLAKRRIVVCDRFHDATVAYQGYGGGVDVRWLDGLGRDRISRVMPHLTLLLDVPTERGFARLRRSHDRMERKERAFHRRVRAGYLALAKREPRRFVVVDAARSPEQIQAQLQAVVAKRLVLRQD